MRAVRRGVGKRLAASAAKKRPTALGLRASRIFRLPARLTVASPVKVTRMARALVSRLWGRERRASLAPLRARSVLALTVLCLALLTAGGASARIYSTDTEGTPTATTAQPTATAWPTSTPTPQPPPPLYVPPGWQVYRAHHFALAFPLDWMATEHVVDEDDGTVAVSVSFDAPDGTEAVGVSEHEALDIATLKRFCAQPGARMTYAGLPMITSLTSSTLRMFVFVSSSGVAYTLLYREIGAPDQIKWLYDSIFATFRPEYATSACA